MSFESEVIECAVCGDVDGPFTSRVVEQFSASGARPNLKLWFCEVHAYRAQLAPQRTTRRYTRGH